MLMMQMTAERVYQQHHHAEEMSCQVPAAHDSRCPTIATSDGRLEDEIGHRPHRCHVCRVGFKLKVIVDIVDIIMSSSSSRSSSGSCRRCCCCRRRRRGTSRRLVVVVLVVVVVVVVGRRRGLKQLF